MEAYSLSMMDEVRKKDKRVAADYSPSALVNGIYKAYLGAYKPRKIRRKPKAKVRPVPSSLDEVNPYTITIVGYLSHPIDLDVFYDAAAVSEETASAKEGISRIVSRNGMVKEVGVEEYQCKEWLPNHINLTLSTGIRVRASSTNIEVIGSKRDDVINEAWSVIEKMLDEMAANGHSVYEERPVLVSSWVAMRNYAISVGFELDQASLNKFIYEHPEYGFSSYFTPSLNCGVHITCPVSTPPPIQADTKERHHFIRVYHTGNTLVSTKGDKKEEKEMFSRFMAMIADAREQIKR